MLNVCLICSALLIVKVIFVITVLFLFLLCVSTILVNEDDQKCTIYLSWAPAFRGNSDIEAYTTILRFTLCHIE